MSAAPRNLTRAVVTLVAASILGAAVASAPAVAEDPERNDDILMVNLDDPKAGITDPLAGVAPIDRNCVDGEVDVNIASLAELGTALGIHSIPTLRRIVAERPWTDATHLISIPGVGPKLLDVLESSACASPIELPPTLENAPQEDFAGVDLQVATSDQLVSLLPKPVATRLSKIAVIPDDLFQIAAPAVPGLSKPLIEELLANDNVAITPHPFAYKDKTWKWVSHKHGGVVSAFNKTDYGLYIQPGSVVGNGAWATVNPLPMDGDVLPKADFHIYGDWVAEVAVQLPQLEDSSPNELWLLHEAADGYRTSESPNLGVGDPGTVTAALSSLSPVLVMYSPAICNQPNAYFLTGNKLVYCNSNGKFDTEENRFTRDGLVERQAAYLAWRQARFDTWRASPMPCPDSGSTLINTTGSMHHLDCTSTAIDGSTASFTWTNNTETLLYFGSMYEVDYSLNDQWTIARGEKGIMTGPILNNWEGNAKYALPGDSVTVSLRQGRDTSFSDARAIPDSTRALMWGTAQVTSIIDGLNDFVELASTSSIVGDVVGGATCLVGVTNQVDAKSSLDCFANIVETALDSAAKAAPVKTSAQRKTKSMLVSAKKAIMIAGSVLTAGDLLMVSTQGIRESGDDRAEYVFLPQPPPPATGGLDASGKYVARASSGQSWLVEPASGIVADVTLPLDLPDNEWVAREIETAGDFNCYVTGLFVWDQVSTYPQANRLRIEAPNTPAILTDEPAPTCAEMTPIWDYTYDGNTPRNVMIRQPDWIVDWAEFIAPDGTMSWIETFEAYSCLAATTPIVWNFPQEAIDSWPEHSDTPIARCP